MHKRSFRHAYLIMTHNNFYCLEKLVSLLDDSRNDIYIHVDRKAVAFPYSLIEKAVHKSALFYVDSISVKWADYSIIQAELILLSCAAKKGYAYYHLLSGADLPLQTQDYIHDFFAKNSGKQLIHCQKQHVLESLNINERISRFYYLPVDRDNLLLKLQRRWNISRRLPTEKLCYGSQWASLTHDAVCYILSKKEWIFKTFCWTHACDEVYKQTILQNSKFADSLYEENLGVDDISSNKRCIIWHGGSHPYIFRTEDYERLISSDYLFARKFDETIDRNIIDLVYTHLSGANRFDVDDKCYCSSLQS